MTEPLPEHYMLEQPMKYLNVRLMGHPDGIDDEVSMSTLYPGMYEGHALRKILGRALFQDAVQSGQLELLPDWSIPGMSR